MEQKEIGLIVEVREYSNTSLILKIFTKEGIIAGFLKGGSAKTKQNLAVFTLVSFTLKKRLEEHLGALKVENLKSFSSSCIKSRAKMLILNSLQEILLFLLQEESPDEELYLQALGLLEFVTGEENELELYEKYLIFELNLLRILGFGLDMEKCALTGERDGLFFISPVTGRCANFNSGEEFREKLFEIPKIYGNLLSKALLSEDLKNAFNINSHFLKNLPNHEKLFSREKIIKNLKINLDF